MDAHLSRAIVSPKRKSGIACELQGNVMTLFALHLFTTNESAVLQEVERRIQKHPEFFAHTPLIIDMTALEQPSFDPRGLIEKLRRLRMMPVLLRAAPQYASLAELLHLGFIPPDHQSAKLAPDAGQAANSDTKSRMIKQLVRSGQRIYARNGDLVVVGSISKGAEIMADGNIHVYGALRGRALAGLRGDENARIFCYSMEAELISIAGIYRVAEDIPPAFNAEAVQIYLDTAGELVTESLSR